MANIYIYDACMGTGKTTTIVDAMNTEWLEGDIDQIVYLAPNLSEVGGSTKDNNGEPVHYSGRIPTACPEVNFQNPVADWRLSKAEHARELLVEGHNLSATHNLFSLITEDDLAVVSQRKTMLVIDEALNTVEPLQFDGDSAVTKADIKLLIDNEFVKADAKGKLRWVKPVLDDHFKYGKIKSLCDSGHLYIADNETVFVWQFPPEILNAFTEVYVLTYLFEGSVMSRWLKLHGLNYEYCLGTTPNSVCRIELERETKSKIKKLLTIRATPKANEIGKRSNALSINWWENANKEKLDKARACFSDAAKNGLRGIPATDMLITCPKKFWTRGRAQGNGYSKATWLASSTRATNDYADKKAVLYLVNKFPNMAVSQYFKSQGYPLDDELYALSEMLQFLWRGCIRNNEPMVVYIPSSRMRGLLISWLNNELELAA